MKLIGQYDSPFVRRVAVTLARYEFAFEHQPWSVFADAELLATLNPLGRVPVLVLDDGEVLIESGAILDHLDERVGEARAMLPSHGPRRRQGLRFCALATGLADKAVSLFVECRLPGTRPGWVNRCETQISRALEALEAERSRVTSAWSLGDALSHADIALACALRFTREAHPQLVYAARHPALLAHAERCEALPEFASHSLPVTIIMNRAS
jgi:glutathione S-transferase